MPEIDPHVITAIYCLVGALLASFVAWALGLEKK
jgi:hypothetical protein